MIVMTANYSYGSMPNHTGYQPEQE